jgi:hypothetical protein
MVYFAFLFRLMGGSRKRMENLPAPSASLDNGKPQARFGLADQPLARK